MTAGPLVLAFDTSGPYCAAALARGADVLAARVDEMQRGQAEHLMGFLQDVLVAEGSDWADLSCLGVGVGPGNFTGIRIAVSAARGLALGLGIPAVGVSAFDTTRRLSGCAQTAVPAPRGQLYLFDAEAAGDPVLCDARANTAVALWSAYDPVAHIGAMATIASERADRNLPPPKPLYVRAADAAPPRDVPPRILP